MDIVFIQLNYIKNNLFIKKFFHIKFNLMILHYFYYIFLYFYFISLIIIEKLDIYDN